MVCFKARQHFQVSTGKIDFFAEAGTKKSMQFYIKIKDVLLRSRNGLPRNTLVSICFEKFKSQNWPNFQDVEYACSENWPTLCAILGLTSFELYGNQCISR